VIVDSGCDAAGSTVLRYSNGRHCSQKEHGQNELFFSHVTLCETSHRTVSRANSSSNSTYHPTTRSLRVATLCNGSLAESGSDLSDNPVRLRQRTRGSLSKSDPRQHPSSESCCLRTSCCC